MTELDKMDNLRARFEITYQQAKQTLAATDGDLAEAVIILEESGTPIYHTTAAESSEDESESFVHAIIEQIKDIIHDGNVTKIRLKKEDKVLIEVPATIGVIGLGLSLFSPLMLAITAAGTVAAISKEYTLEIEKSDRTIETRGLKWIKK